jgi:hypothetical protein
MSRATVSKSRHFGEPRIGVRGRLRSPDKLELFDISGFSDKSENDKGGCFQTFYEFIKIKELYLSLRFLATFAVNAFYTIDKNSFNKKGGLNFSPPFLIMCLFYLL